MPSRIPSSPPSSSGTIATDNGIPDRNLDVIYDELFASPYGSAAEQYLTEDRRSAQVEYAIDADASQREAAADAAEFADDFRYTATATGGIVVFAAVTDLIFASAIEGLILAVGLTAVFLVISYAALERKPLLGIVNVFPILISIAFLIGTMRYLGMSLNALTATILSISVGLGIAYSVHATHRFIDELKAADDALTALVTTLSGTGGALMGSMLTTVAGNRGTRTGDHARSGRLRFADGSERRLLVHHLDRCTATRDAVVGQIQPVTVAVGPGHLDGRRLQVVDRSHFLSTLCRPFADE
ncbi:MMPL family protein [Natrinema hispanicum]|uniref:MMPL family protein n=1 Tax=Natrinema hispanicum TaxID=392421 RepID=A0A482Y8Y6_9EURY|nr:MMPL family protein [Natrinema hispanicum]